MEIRPEAWYTVLMEKILHGTILTGADREALTEEAWKLAGRLLCENGTGEDGCAHCRKAAKHIHPDVTFVERMTDKEGKLRKELVVEQIRALEKDAVVLPNEAARKVYVIREAELLNANAQNAFLKLLEEPPEFVVFLLCAENPNILLPTIRSRCAVHRVAAPGGEEEEADTGRLTTLAEEYLAALGSEVELLRVCNDLERLESAEFRAFVSQLRLTAAEKLRGAELLALERELEKLSEMLKVNVSVRHAAGYLATWRYEP